MPIFEYICQQCDHRFEAIVLGSQKAACPKCESKRLSQQLSSFAVGGDAAKFLGPPFAPDFGVNGQKTNDSAVGACGTCGDPRGPGACSMN